MPGGGGGGHCGGEGVKSGGWVPVVRGVRRWGWRVGRRSEGWVGMPKGKKVATDF